MQHALLRNRSFRLLWSAHVVSSFGDALTSLALLLIAQRLTGSTAAVAATAVAIALPQLLVGMPAGVLVDRWNRRRVMIASDLARAALVVGFITVTTTDRLWLLYALAFTQSAVGTFFNPARASLLAELVPADRLLPANSLSEMSRVVAGVAGVGVAGLLASASSSLSVVFVVDAFTFLVSAAFVALVRPTPAKRREETGPILAGIAAGLRLVFGSRVLVGVVVTGAVAMLGLGAVNVLLVPFVVADLGASEAWFGALEGAQVAAMVTTGALLAAYHSRARPTVLIVVAAAGLGASIAAIAACSAAWQLMIVLFAAGWFVTPLQASVTTILQTAVPAHLRGRAHATFGTLVTSAGLGSMALAGVAAGAAGTRSVFLAAGGVVAAAGLWAAVAFRNPGRALPPAPAEVI
jgi:MFS family permease